MEKWKRKAAAAAVAAAVAAVSTAPAMAAAAPDGNTDAEEFAASTGASAQWTDWQNSWKKNSGDWTKISLAPGADSSQLNFAWYTKKAAGFVPKLRISTDKSMKDAVEYDAAQTEVADEKDSSGSTYMSNKVTAKNLKEGTAYYYEYETADGVFSEPAEYTVRDDSNFSFIFVGDPQIGSSNPRKGGDGEEFYKAQSDAVMSDSFIWSRTLDAAMDRTNDRASFVLSAGDQIQTTKKKAPNNDAATSEIEYTGFLSADSLRSLPVATTVGNHDADNANYGYHFNTANESRYGKTEAGGDYWFTYGDALFIDLNLQGKDNSDDHITFIKDTIKENPDAKWKIVTLHQDIYGTGEHSNEPDVVKLRYELAPVFEKYGVDVVFTGHDHTYSRSKIMKGAQDRTKGYSQDSFEKMLDRDIDAGTSTEQRFVAPQNIKDSTSDPEEIAYLRYLNSIMDKDAVRTVRTTGSTAVNPDGVLYITGDSASGSKFYDLVSRRQSYIAARWQKDAPTYSVVDVKDGSLTINTYRSDNGSRIDKSFTILRKTATKKTLSKSVNSAKRLLKSSRGAKKETSRKALASAVRSAEKILRSGKSTGTDRRNAVMAISDAEKAFRARPAAEAISKISSKSGLVRVRMKKNSDAAGYEIRYSRSRKFKNAVTVSSKSTVKKIRGLRRGRKYYFKARAYKVVGKKTVRGSFGKTVSIKVK
jgi:predicted phosphodiesterase